MTDNSKARNPKRVLHVLLTEAGEPLASALVEFLEGHPDRRFGASARIAGNSGH
jgi:hypothetical protein